MTPLTNYEDSLKNHRKPLKTLCTLVSNVGATMIFSLQNMSGLPTRECLHSTSAKIATINGGKDDNIKSFWFT